MQKTLHIPAYNSFRPDRVLGRIRDHLDRSESVSVSSRDHPETFPEGVRYVGDDWQAMLSHRPKLAVIDNLTFEDPRGRTFTRWDGDRIVDQPACLLDDMIRSLEEAGTGELILVTEGHEVSAGWIDWARHRDVLLKSHDPDVDPWRKRRHWDVSRDIVGLGYRRFFMDVRTGPAEALLGLAAEYATERWEYENTEDPRALNARCDLCRRMLMKYALSADPRELLTALDDLHDLVAEVVGFPPLPMSSENLGGRDAV